MDWCERFFRAVDEKEARQLADTWFTNDLELQFANWPRVTGKDEVVTSLERFFASIAGLSHNLIDVVSEGQKAAVESLVTYHRLDGESVTLPVATHLVRDGDRVRCIKVFIDQGPLYATVGS